MSPLGEIMTGIPLICDPPNLSGAAPILQVSEPDCRLLQLTVLTESSPPLRNKKLPRLLPRFKHK